MAPYHTPVLLEESITGLNIRPDGIYVDLTYGGGGHSNAILQRLKTGKLIAFDQDEDVLSQVVSHPAFTLRIQNYRYLKNNLDFLQISRVNGILADLGVSSHQFDESDRGFTFRNDAPLDMRMNQLGDLSAADVINRYPQQKLIRIFREFAEIKHPEKFVDAIIFSREKVPLKTSGALADLVRGFFPGKFQNKILARIFQALRIEVNHELDSLREMLQQTVEVLEPGGRLVVIAYHSLEDRLVKNFMKFGRFDQPNDLLGRGYEKPFQVITKKVITPSAEEVRRNPRARSAKLRIAEKI